MGGRQEALIASGRSGATTDPDEATLLRDLRLEELIAKRRRRLASGWLTEVSNGQGGTLASGTQRQYLNSLSNLFRRAGAEGYVLPGHNPVAALMEKPQAARLEAAWLEIPDAALILEAARLHRPKRPDLAIPAHMLSAIVGTFLLTSGRKSEVLGLGVDDVSFDRRTVTFRPHPWRRLKNRYLNSKRATEASAGRDPPGVCLRRSDRPWDLAVSRTASGL